MSAATIAPEGVAPPSPPPSEMRIRGIQRAFPASSRKKCDTSDCRVHLLSHFRPRIRQNESENAVSVVF